VGRNVDSMTESNERCRHGLLQGQCAFCRPSRPPCSSGVDHGTHPQICPDHAAYLKLLLDETGKQGVTKLEVGRAYGRQTNDRAMFILNNLLSERRPDLPGLENEYELRYLAVDICGWHPKQQVTRALQTTPADKSHVIRRSADRLPWRQALQGQQIVVEGD